MYVAILSSNMILTKSAPTHHSSRPWRKSSDTIEDLCKKCTNFMLKTENPCPCAFSTDGLTITLKIYKKSQDLIIALRKRLSKDELDHVYDFCQRWSKLYLTIESFYLLDFPEDSGIKFITTFTATHLYANAVAQQTIPPCINGETHKIMPIVLIKTPITSYLVVHGKYADGSYHHFSTLPVEREEYFDRDRLHLKTLKRFMSNMTGEEDFNVQHTVDFGNILKHTYVGSREIPDDIKILGCKIIVGENFDKLKDRLLSNSFHLIEVDHFTDLDNVTDKNMLYLARCKSYPVRIIVNEINVALTQERVDGGRMNYDGKNDRVRNRHANTSASICRINIRNFIKS